MSATIYEPKGKAREYSPLALNYYKGCNHNCKYCYVKPMMKRFNKNYSHNVVTSKGGKVTKEVLSLIEKSCKKHQNSKKQVLLNFTSDPYNSLEIQLGPKRGLTYFALTQLLKYNIPTVILTKNHKAIRDIDLFKKFGDNIMVGFSLTFDNLKDSQEWESGASTPNNRLSSLTELKHKGIKTWASFEPVIYPKQSLNLLKEVCFFEYVDFVKIGKLNNYKGLDKDIDWTDFLNKAVEICRRYKIPFYIKKDLLKFKDENLQLTENETNSDYLFLKNTKMLTNQLF
ncbi:MAG: radical SAM protein [Deltaproteobacteria bacterium]|nr:radical SAM protein [Deltaproteobacteria bacterium]